MNHYLNITRLSNLIKREVLTNAKAMLIILGAISGVVLFIFTISALNKNTHGTHVPLFASTFMVTGLVLSSLAYRDLLNKNKSYAYLTLPVSNLERLISMLFITTLIYIITYIVYYFLLSTILNAFASYFTQQDFEAFDVADTIVWKTIKIYLVVQSVFLLGAASFKKFPLPLTLLTLFVASIIMVLIAVGIMAAFTYDMRLNDIDFNLPSYLDRRYGLDFERISKIVFWYLLAPFCWFVTYLKLKEKEV
ncbi:hypothetical protein QQ008_08160 [Fulvivirgaceae bacterium BMA10]|uniref:ABC transporter permease n=1 Tax=Splendidivirga corallicola TaxID=3051826 RepID=A0ABT8KKU1_9BACT|nr:hypothetical protein [Fulvivirgaceae bacterium BMA10]